MLVIFVIEVLQLCHHGSVKGTVVAVAVSLLVSSASGSLCMASHCPEPKATETELNSSETETTAATVVGQISFLPEFLWTNQSNSHVILYIRTIAIVRDYVLKQLSREYVHSGENGP